jgi:glutamate-1-semialdehyde 2,1-aminomutase
MIVLIEATGLEQSDKIIIEGREMGKGQELYRKARTLIPGGTQLFSKRPERFLPDLWPAYFSKARGARVWDLDGVEYLDMTTAGNGACALGYADPDVEQAVVEAVCKGSMTILNAPEEVELAELICHLHPWADMVRYARSGGEVLTIAIRIARASTGRDKIAFCGYHGWHDWYLAANLSEEHALDGHLMPGLDPTGVPRGLQGTILPFSYNNAEELRNIVSESGPDLAAIIMEPTRNHGPEPGFLEEVRSIAHSNGSVLIFDEITSAWRMDIGGIHLTYGVDPDIAVFAKATSNGFPMGVVIGARAIMEAAQSTFISSAFWTERVGPVAALATIKKHLNLKVHNRLAEIGERVQAGWLSAGKRVGLQINVSGIPPLSHLGFSGELSDEIATLFTQLMLDRGILASGPFYPSYAQTDDDVSRYLEAVGEVFGICAEAIADGQLEKLLKGPVRHADFRRLT